MGIAAGMSIDQSEAWFLWNVVYVIFPFFSIYKQAREYLVGIGILGLGFVKKVKKGCETGLGMSGAYPLACIKCLMTNLLWA